MATKRTTQSKGKTRSSAGRRSAGKTAATQKSTAKKPAAKSRAAAASKSRPAAKKPAARTNRGTSRAAGTGAAAERRRVSGGAGRGGASRGETGLSRSAQRAKWVQGPDERGDRAGQTLATRSHEVIQRWAEQRNAKPATVEGSWHEERPGVLRFDFPGYGGRRLQEVSWDDWFRTFDDRKLVFLYQEEKRDGTQSNFFRFDSPEREEA
ncbi:MAG: hypothetical protein ACE147_02085 [Candidatus Methylomirabilales bacterium]